MIAYKDGKSKKYEAFKHQKNDVNREEWTGYTWSVFYSEIQVT